MVIISLSGIVLLIYLISLWKSLGKAQKTNIAILLILSIFMLFYWSLSNQTSISIPLFIKSNIDLHILGFNMPVTTVMATQLSLLIIINPFFGILWQKLGQYKKDRKSVV